MESLERGVTWWWKEITKKEKKIYYNLYLNLRDSSKKIKTYRPTFTLFSNVPKNKIPLYDPPTKLDPLAAELTDLHYNALDKIFGKDLHLKPSDRSQIIFLQDTINQLQAAN